MLHSQGRGGGMVGMKAWYISEEGMAVVEGAMCCDWAAGAWAAGLSGSIVAKCIAGAHA